MEWINLTIGFFSFIRGTKILISFVKRKLDDYSWRMRNRIKRLRNWIVLVVAQLFKNILT